MSHPHIFPECYADTLLVEMLGFALPSHKLGIGAVQNVLTDLKKSVNAVGIVDNDKKKPKHFGQFKFEETKENFKNLKLDKQTVLVICPAFEDWGFENASSVGVDPAKYGFRTKKYFKEVSKKVNASDNQDLKQLLNTLKQKQAPGFTQLKTWICEGAGIDENDLS